MDCTSPLLAPQRTHIARIDNNRRGSFEEHALQDRPLENDFFSCARSTHYLILMNSHSFPHQKKTPLVHEGVPVVSLHNKKNIENIITLSLEIRLCHYVVDS